MEKITLNAELLLTLNSKEEWIRRVPNALPKKNRYNEQFLWIDKNGNVLECGADFSAAEEQASYPVNVYRTQPVSSINITHHIT